jgi:hypothetical protein
MKTILEGNKIIKEAINNNIPFIAGKMGAVEQQVMLYKLAERKWDDSLRWHASNHAGITPPTDDILKLFSSLYEESLFNTDLLTIWFPDNINSNEYAISYKYCPNAEFIGGLQALEPFYHPEPWSYALKGKKVLVVHPFEDSIKEQYAKKHLLFQDQSILPDFELITLKTYQTHGGGNTDLPWNICYHDMAEKINKIDFDVALIGCGAYGLPLCNVVKNMGKPAIHVGGGLQIMFGIKGNRWDNMPAVSKYYNEHWKRPYDSEKTKNHQVVEGSTYW